MDGLEQACEGEGGEFGSHGVMLSAIDTRFARIAEIPKKIAARNDSAGNCHPGGNQFGAHDEASRLDAIMIMASCNNRPCFPAYRLAQSKRKGKTQAMEISVPPAAVPKAPEARKSGNGKTMATVAPA
ncbi:hypothetical protein GCM10007291_16640 [Gemmobacter nanjingensis]|uniref:Uncharacterized protein n=1 Tax=Gemmobacter nanjingensis TaxID=488454 RepID=A0ABQ3FCW8_9RHOB|nr:hypothetical protein GCM10007291_16640 [Gemmobacter nanjingensis]